MAEPQRATREARPTSARAAYAQPETLDEAAREIDVTFSTGARALNFVPGVGICDEELSLAPDAVRLDRLASGNAPVLDGHRSGGGAASVLGRVVSARLEDGVGVARLRFSSAPDVESTWQKIKDGTLRSVSVGYDVLRHEKVSPAAAGQRAVVRVTEWSPFEISVVPIPADLGATVRAEFADLPTAPTAAEAATQEQTMAEASAAASVSTPAAEIDVQAERQSAAVAERMRIAGLGPVLASARGLVAQAAADDLHRRAIEEGWSPESFRGHLWDALAAGSRAAVASVVPAVTPEPATPEARDEAAWQADAALRAEFADDFASYRAFRRAEADGRARVLSRRG